MPRVDTTPVRRTKRDAQQRLSRGGGPVRLARTAASVRAAAEAAAVQASVSAPPVKREPVPTPIPAASSASAPISSKTWRHPDELPYIRTAGKTWTDMAIVRFLTAHAFGLPPRSTSTVEAWVNVRCADGSEVVLPRGYRLPLLWVAKFQWTSVRLVLTADPAILQREWDSTKFEILHIARLCAALLDKARAQMEEHGAIERGWRCPPFDRAMRRYHYDWLIMRDEFVRDFWREFGEEEFQSDILKLGWAQWVLKGHKGFTLTKKEVAQGITAEEFTKGLIIDEEADTFEWNESPQAPPLAPAQKNVTPEAAQQAAVPVIHPAARVPSPTRVVSFRVRPGNTFRVSLTEPGALPEEAPQSEEAAQASEPSVAEESASPPQVLENSSASPDVAMEDAPAPQNSDRGTTAPLEENPSASPDVSMAVDAPSGLYQETPGPVQRIPFPGERRRSQASGSGTSSALGAEPSESRASQPANDMRAESDVGPSAGIISTKMGSLAPGCAVLRGESASAEGEGVAEENNPESEEEDGDEEEEATGREVEMGVGDLKAKQEMIDAVLPDVGTDDFDDDDLQLLYPDQPSPSAESSASRAGGRRSPAASSGNSPSRSSNASPSRSQSRSASPGPPLSSARFPQVSPTETRFSPVSTQTHFSPVSPSAIPESAAAVFRPGPHPYEEQGIDISIVARFVQSCGALGEEVRALRAEVGMLRSELASPVQARVREVEEGVRSPASPVGAGPSTGSAARWAHPLQHLIAAEDPAPMDVDPPAVAGNAPAPAVKYAAADGPPRSRKFTSFSGV